MQIQIQDDISIIKPTLLELKNNFKQGITRDVAFRKQQLNQLIKAINQNEKKIAEALESDLGYKGFGSVKILHIASALKNIEYCRDNFQQWAKETKVDTNMICGNAKSKIVKEPLGTCLVIGSWNYPLTTAVSPAAEAIAAGNCVVVKPSELAPKLSNLIKTLFQTYLDQRFYRVIEGAIEVAKNISTHPWDLIIFTGSPEKGKLVAKSAAENLTPCILELGGKSPTIVDEDANINSAALRISSSKFSNCGQTCIAPDFIFCHEKVVDKFTDEIKKATLQFYSKNPKTSPDYPRIVTQFHTKRIIDMIDPNQHKGEVVMGGKEVDVNDRFVEPTIIKLNDKNSKLMKEEIFGPVLPILTFQNMNSVIEYINENPKPLALYYFGANKQHVKRLEFETSSGAFVQNDCLIQILNPKLPFGGVGNSGSSSLHGKIGFDNCSHLKPVMYSDNFNGFPTNVRFPPYDEKKIKTVNFLSRFANVYLKTKVKRTVKKLIILGLIAYGTCYLYQKYMLKH